MRILLPIFGLVLVACGMRAFWRARTRTALLYALCWTATCPALSLWPVQNSTLVDGVLHAPGVGRFLDVICTWIAQSCMFLFTLSFTNGWRRGPKVALAAFGAILFSECVLWSILALSEGAHLAHVIYDGFFGSPPLVLIWNLAYGFSIGFGFALGGAGYLHILHTAHDLHSRVNAWAGSLASADGILYGLLVMAQAVASSLGHGATSVQGLMPMLMLAGALAMVGFTWVAIYGRPLWRYLSRLFSLQHREHALRRVRKDLIDANVLLSDRLVQLHAYADPAVVRAVADECTDRLIPTYQRQVALEAARWITLSRANAGKAPWDESAALPQDAEMVVEVLQRAESESYFYADVFRVVALVLGADRLPEQQPERRGARWRRHVAALIREVMASQARTSGSDPGMKAEEPLRVVPAIRDPLQRSSIRRADDDRVMVASTYSYQAR